MGSVGQNTMHNVSSDLSGYEDYVKGFGEAESEYWIGLENMRLLTNEHRLTDLKIVMTSEAGVHHWIRYHGFRIGGRQEHYRLHLGPRVAGNATDELRSVHKVHIQTSFCTFFKHTLHSRASRHHSGHSFSARDADHDGGGGHCAEIHRSAFWFHNCFHATLNARHGTDNLCYGILWSTGCKRENIQAKVEMMVSRPVK